MKKFEKKDLQHPVNYDWKTNFDYFWNTKSNQMATKIFFNLVITIH